MFIPGWRGRGEEERSDRRWPIDCEFSEWAAVAENHVARNCDAGRVARGRNAEEIPAAPRECPVMRLHAAAAQFCSRAADRKANCRHLASRWMLLWRSGWVGGGQVFGERWLLKISSISIGLFLVDASWGMMYFILCGFEFFRQGAVEE